MIRVGLLLLGGWVALCGTLAHRQTWSAGGTVWPWGLALALAVTATVAFWSATRLRLGGAWFALGWSGLLVLERLASRGSNLVATDAIGWVFLLGGLVIVTAFVVRPPRVNA